MKRHIHIYSKSSSNT